MRYEVFTAVKMSMFVFTPEDGGSLFLRNFDIYLQIHTALQPGRLISTLDFHNAK
jgi:hypothetical protein